MKTIKNRLIEIRPDVYPVVLVLAIGDLKYLKATIIAEVYKDYEEAATDKAEGLTSTRNGSTAIILPAFDHSPKIHGILAHEIFHAVNHQLEWLGIQFHGQSNEAYAYLIGYYTEKIYQQL